MPPRSVPGFATPRHSVARATRRLAAAFAAAALFAWLPAPASAAAPFGLTLYSPNAVNAIDVATGDFNGDGNPDIVSARSNVTFVSIWMGNGSGNFPTSTTLATAAKPWAVATGDLNGDGKLDIVAVGGSSVSVLMGNGDGTFAAHVDYAVPAGTTFRSVVLADVNGDGVLDMVVASPAGNAISVLLGNGNGTFAPRTDYATLPSPNSVAVSDLNGDGRPDLVTISKASPGYVSVFLGTGGGAFGARTDFACGAQPGSIALGDLNGDGNPDAAVALTGGYSVLLGTGSGTFGAATTTAGTESGEMVVIGDVDADNRPELVMTSNGGVVYLPGVGDGTFGAETAAVTSGIAYNGLTLADVNRDGSLDIVACSVAQSRLAIVLSNRPLFGAQRPVATGSFFNSLRPGARTLATGDINGDGFPDAAVANWNDTTGTVCFGAGDGSFSSSVTLRTGLNPSSAAVVDLNGDHLADVLFSYYNASTVSVYLAQPGNTFAPRVDYAVGPQPMAVAAGDVNGDGKPDMICLSVAGNLSLLLNNGDGTFGPVTTIPTMLSGGGVQLALATGDLNGDGFLDIVASNTAYRYSALLGNGAGQFTAHTDSVYASGVGNPWSIAIGDLTGDGSADIAFSNRDAGGIEIKQGNGAGLFTPLAGWPAASPVSACNSVLIGDVNGDGHMDLVMSAGPGYMLGDGLGNFGPFTVAPFLNFTSLPLAPGNLLLGTFVINSYSTALTDMDGDGRADLLVAGFPYTDLLGNQLNVQLGLKPTSLALSLPAGPIVQSQPITLTATVNVPAAGSGTPVDADSVTFFDGFDALGKAGVLGNVATLTCTVPWAGLRTFRAVYGGSAPAWMMKGRGFTGLPYYGVYWDYDKSKYFGSISPGRSAVVLPSSVLDVPTPRPASLALERMANPALGGRLGLAFSLPTAAPARLDVLDVTGRRVFTREVGSLGAGRHTVQVGGDLPLSAGVYFVRLSQGATSVNVRATVLR